MLGPGHESENCMLLQVVGLNPRTIGKFLRTTKGLKQEHVGEVISGVCGNCVMGVCDGFV